MRYSAFVDVDLSFTVDQNWGCVVQGFSDIGLEKAGNILSNTSTRFAGSMDGFDSEVIARRIEGQVQDIYSNCGVEGHFSVTVTS